MLRSGPDAVRDRRVHQAPPACVQLFTQVCTGRRRRGGARRGRLPLQPSSGAARLTICTSCKLRRLTAFTSLASIAFLPTRRGGKLLSQSPGESQVTTLASEPRSLTCERAHEDSGIPPPTHSNDNNNAPRLQQLHHHHHHQTTPPTRHSPAAHGHHAERHRHCRRTRPGWHALRRCTRSIRHPR